MSSKQERRRSGVFNPEQPVVKAQRWTSRNSDKHSTSDDIKDDDKQREKEKKRSHRSSVATPSRSVSRTISRRPSMPSSLRSTAASDVRADAENSTGAFTPNSTTPTVGGGDSPTTSTRSRRHADREREHVKSLSGSRSNSISVPFFGRSSSRKRKESRNEADTMMDREPVSRPRTATLEGGRREQSPTAMRGKSMSRQRDAPSSGAEYLASVPMATQMPSAPSISSLGSPVQSPSPQPGTRSISPVSSGTADSIASALPSANARRILHLMRTLNGRMSGSVIFRRGFGNPWSQSYCYIHEENGSLMYESRGSEGAHRVLVPDLRGSSVRSNLDGDVAYLELSLPQTSDEVHIKLQTQSDFDAWFAALLHWTPRDTNSESSNETRPESEMGSTRASSADMTSTRRASVNNPISTRERAASNKSARSDRSKSIIPGVTKENPVIKIGKMIYWDTNVGYSNTSAALGQPSTRRPSTSRMQSVSSRRWRRISGQLRENGELKLHSDADNSLISVVQLSQLSRCAIQRLDPSVLESDFCIAIYPQYTSSYTNTQPGFIRPIFLSLESRVLYEVWFVLLRAFTMPSIYGPRVDPDESELGDDGTDRDLESMIATSTTYTFRMERSLSVRIVEAKMQPVSNKDTDSGFSGGFGRHQSNTSPDKHGYYAEILLDNETRGKTVAKYDGLNPLWGENFEFQDLPPVLNNASVVVKRRPPEQASSKDDTKSIHDAFGEQQGGFTNLAFDVVCGKVEIQMEELEPEKDVEKWWPVLNMHGQRVGEILVKVRADEGIILMARDYEQLSVMLHRFSNVLTLHIAQMIPSELKRLSDSLLNIFQVSGKAGEWIMALVEEEIDGSHKDSPITRLRYTRRAGSMENSDPHGNGGASTDRELIVRDLNKNATLEANLLFRGNTLLTKSLDTHMRRVGKEYLEESLAATLQEINDKDLDCEVDPNRVQSASDVDRNWGRLLLFTQEVWQGILSSKSRCPIELRIIFRHVRACAEDRYGDFLRSVSYSSVSGFLFLRFFCPAVLNPKLFGLLQGKNTSGATEPRMSDHSVDDIKPRARRTFTLIAKSLQTMANMASFGTKEPWMEPMNIFLFQHRESFKTFIDDVCHVPEPISNSAYPKSSSKPTYPPGVVSAEQHLSYTTPMTIMQRLPPSSREGFPSLPYLIDQARSFADLIHLWLDAIAALSSPGDAATLPGKSHADILQAITSTEGDLKDFHRLCEELNTRTQECLNRAERAERPDSPHSFQWEDVINQLQKAQIKNVSAADKDSNGLIDGVESNPAIEATLRQLRGQEDDMDEDTSVHGIYVDPAMSRTEPALVDSTPRSHNWGRPGSATVGGTSFHGSAGRNYSQSVHGSPSQSASTSVSNVSSTVSSDTEHTTTALPNYEREVRHRERREMARFQIQKQVEAARSREKERDKDKDKKKSTKLIPNLRKKKEKEKEKDGSAKANGDGTI